MLPALHESPAAPSLPNLSPKDIDTLTDEFLKNITYHASLSSHIYKEARHNALPLPPCRLLPPVAMRGKTYSRQPLIQLDLVFNRLFGGKHTSKSGLSVPWINVLARGRSASRSALDQRLSHPIYLTALAAPNSPGDKERKTRSLRSRLSLSYFILYPLLLFSLPFFSTLDSTFPGFTSLPLSFLLSSPFSPSSAFMLVSLCDSRRQSPPMIPPVALAVDTPLSKLTPTDNAHRQNLRRFIAGRPP